MGLSGTPNNGKENISYELGDLYLLAHSIDGVAQEMIFFVPFFKKPKVLHFTLLTPSLCHNQRLP